MKPGERRTLALEEVAAEARELWLDLPPGSVLWLTGELGSGKTTFVQALAEAAGADRASSPTFSLVNEYECPSGVIYHADCYRLKSVDEALDLDFPGILRSALLLLIEWPERAGFLAPPADVSLSFSHTGDPDVRLLEREL
jgi:tRNA threonylcarbamoyladenosine biosynthesis protein TsaE